MSDTHLQPPPDHSVKVTHLVFGLLFLGIAGIWALVVNEVITEDRLTILAPALLIGAGVIGLVASLASTRNRRSAQRRLAGDNDDSDEPNLAENHLENHNQEIR